VRSRSGLEKGESWLFFGVVLVGPKGSPVKPKLWKTNAGQSPLQEIVQSVVIEKAQF